MGSYLSSMVMGKPASAVDEASKKRKLEEEEIDEILRTPKVKKLKTTSQYIYETLFKNGENSDVTLVALGKCWRLHRVYLRQSPYFESMFMGNWKESHDSVVSMTIMDDNITVEALEKTLGFLYQDELSVTGEQVVGVLAAAVLLQLDPVIQYCSAIMRDTINSRTFLQYFHVANRYGVVEVEKLCVEWMERCLLTSLSEHPTELWSLPLDMLQKALSSPNLFVIQTEFSVYVFLKMWLFLQLHPNFEGTHDEICLETHKFFKARQGPCFLNTAQGQKYRPIFWQLRLVYIVNHYLDMEVLASDNIIPRHWLQPAITRQWYNMLRIAQGKDTGPSDVPEATFDRECVRCGRCFFSDTQHIWRWTGFNFDLDLVLFFDGSKLTMKRNARRPNLFPPTDARKIMYRVTMVDGQRQQGMRVTSGLRQISFGRHEEVTLLQLDNTDHKYPLYLSANFLVFTPSEHPPMVHPSELLVTNPNKPPPRPYRHRKGSCSTSARTDGYSSDDSVDISGDSDEVDDLGVNSRNETTRSNRGPQTSARSTSPTFNVGPSNLVVEPPISVDWLSTSTGRQSTSVAGPSASVLGSSTAGAGPSSSIVGPSSSVVGPPSSTFGSSNPNAGTSTSVSRPSASVSGSSYAVAGPSNTANSRSRSDASQSEPRSSSRNDDLPTSKRTLSQLSSLQYPELHRPGLIFFDVSDLQRDLNDRDCLLNRISDAIESVRREAGSVENNPHPADQVRDVGVQEYNDIAPNPPGDAQHILNEEENENDHNFIDDNEQEENYDHEEEEDFDENDDDEYDQAIDDGQQEEVADEQLSDDSDEALIEGEASDDDDLAELEDVIRRDDLRLVNYLHDEDRVIVEDVGSDGEDSR